MEYTSDLIKWLLIIIILSILGLNIFNYFSQVTDGAAKITEVGASSALDVTSNTIKNAGQGTKDVTDTISGELDEIANALDIHVVNKSKETPIPDDSGSDIQTQKKTGYCLIGEEKGYRSCMYVGKRDTCMSGEIFPSLEICINPSLRA